MIASRYNLERKNNGCHNYEYRRHCWCGVDLPVLNNTQIPKIPLKSLLSNYA